MTSSTADTVDHPFFARIWPAIAAHETEQMRELRRENLAGLSGRVLEVGAGTGTNFELYPDSVAQVVAVEPEQRLAVRARDAAAVAHVPIVVTDRTVESLSAAEPFDAVVCSLVLCSVPEPGHFLAELRRVLKPGGELRFFEHVRSSRPLLGVFQDVITPPWSVIGGGCHLNRDSLGAINAAGFEIDELDRFAYRPLKFVPAHAHILGRAHNPGAPR